MSERLLGMRRRPCWTASRSRPGALKGNVTVEPLRRRPRVERSAIEDERERLATFLAD